MPGHTKCCTCHAKSSHQTVWCSKMQPFSGNQRPNLLTSLMNMSLVLRLWREMRLADPLQMSHACHRLWNCYKALTFCSFLARIPCTRHAKSHLNLQKWSEHVVFLTFWLGKVLRATTAYTFSASQLPKVLGGWGVLYILTWKCASRYKSVHFFNISTSKSALNVVCFVHFDLEMCFAPQRRALFRRLNFQKCSETVSFNTFDFELCFAPQRRATFHLSLIWPAALASLLFDPREPQIMGKSTFSTFSRAGIFFLLTLSLLSSALLFYDSSHLCFSICPYCRKFDF